MALQGASVLLLGKVLGFTGARNTCFDAATIPFPHGGWGPELCNVRGGEQGLAGRITGRNRCRSRSCARISLGSRDKVFLSFGFFWRWGTRFGGPHRTNAGRGCSSPSNWRSQWEAAGPAALAAQGRGGNLRTCGSREAAARGGAEPGQGPGRREREAEAGPQARGASSRRAAPVRAPGAALAGPRRPAVSTHRSREPSW